MRPSPFLTSMIIGLAAASTAVAQDTANGEKLFAQNCATCHSVNPEVTPGQGPGLWGVVGRQVAKAPGFDYSDALAKAGATGTAWTAANLDRFLSGPNQMMPGTLMPVTVSAKAERADLIAYLSNLYGAQAIATSIPAQIQAAKASAASGGYRGWIDDVPGKATISRPRTCRRPMPASAPAIRRRSSPNPMARCRRCPAISPSTCSRRTSIRGV